jgi:hypothetical protein
MMRSLAPVFGGLAILAAAAAQGAVQSRPVKTVEADVVVYGATASGVIAAVAAGREGKSVVLVEPGGHVGGMVSGGLGVTDVGNAQAIGGYAREFFDRVHNHYLKEYGEGSEQVKDCAGGFRFEPHVAERVFKDLLDEGPIPTHFHCPLSAVERQGNRIVSVTADPDKGPLLRFKAAVFIDASYEGDLMARAKVRYAVGREGKDQYGESIAGVQKHSPAHQWGVRVAPFGDDKKLLPLIQAGSLAAPGSGDKRTQAYNFRLCMTQRPDLRVPFPRPAGYDPARYELLARYLQAKPDLKVGQLMNPVKVPNGKTDTNNNGPFSTDHIGANWDYPDADPAARKRIWQDHVDYQQGFHWFLANDPRVPESLRKEMNTWGLAKGEFQGTAGWPHQLYVREARRMVGEYVMTQADIMEKRTKDDSVGLGSYNTDSHHVQRVVGPDGFVLNEGDFQVPVQPYAIPYRSLVPRAGECQNLLVPVCCSASHVAYGTIRMEPVYMILGQASGVAASLAVDGKTTVQQVPADKLRARLKAQKAVLSPDEIVKKGAASGLDPATLGGIVVDAAAAARTGGWVFSAATVPFVGAGYHHDNNEGHGEKKVRFTPKLPQTGRYEVRLFYPAHPNRATNALVVIHSADGDKSIHVNQRQPAGAKGHLLGVFRFETGASGYVEVRNDGADGYVVADAVQWLPAS